MNPGDTFFGFDKRGHLWTVLTDEDANGEVVVANFTTHEDGVRRTCSADCLGWETARHRARDQRPPILLQPLNQQPLLRNQRVEPLRLPVEEGGDVALLVGGWEG